jgi:hypothetical protein
MRNQPINVSSVKFSEQTSRFQALAAGRKGGEQVATRLGSRHGLGNLNEALGPIGKTSPT